MDGILVVDKSRGPTSHDVVSHARRALRERAIGHAGTLDPMATGLLVLLVGEATRLSPYLTSDDKAYEATVRFGEGTDTLDAEGVVTERAPDGWRMPDAATVTAALAAMVGPMLQVPPAVSAIKRDGVAMHERTRRGEVVELEARPVVLRSATVRAVRVDEASCDVSIACSKGFYVRSLARDLAASLGTVGHLTALRRVKSGALTLDGALSGEVLRAATKGDEAARAAVRAAVRPMTDAATLMRVEAVTAEHARDLSHGRPVASDAAEGEGVLAMHDGRIVCIAKVRDGLMSVMRGFASAAGAGGAASAAGAAGDEGAAD